MKPGWLVATFMIAGCHPGTSEASLAGRWEGKPLPAAGKAEDPGQKLAEGMMGAFGGINLELKQDHTFHLQMLFIPVDGEWALSGTTITLTPKKVMGMLADQMESTSNGKTRANKPMDIEVSPDGKTMTMKGGQSKGDIQFTREQA